MIDMREMPKADYSAKSEKYFSGARRLFIDDLPVNPKAKLLEIGCGNGDTAAYALVERKCGWCCGVELCERAAEAARPRLNRVIVGNVETMEIDFDEGYFDILVMSEVLEHLVDPWAVLRRLRRLLKPGGLVYSGSPMFVTTACCGHCWPASGAMKTREFSMQLICAGSARQLIEICWKSCGFRVDHVGPAVPLRFKARTLNALSLGRFQYLFHSQIYLKAHCE